MTKTKNFSLPEPYLSMYEDLDARGEFKRAHGNFSKFVQHKIEEFHEDPQRVRAEHHKEQEERHRKLKEALADKIEDFDPEEETKTGGDEEKQFFQDFLEQLQGKKGTKDWYDQPYKAYKSLENGWIRKYSKKFTSVQEEQFRERFQNHIGEEKIQESLEIDLEDL